MDNSIGVLLTSHKRPHTLRPQLAAIDAQTVKPADVIIWHNDGGVQPDTEAMRGRKVVAANFNSGVWARFSAALWLLPYEFVVVLDDDTIPGSGWLDRCRRQYHKRRALLGVNGVTFGNGRREERSYTGLFGSGSQRTEVDIVGHGWFIHRFILQEACDRLGRSDLHTAGEDYHMAYAAQMLGLSTEVPGYRYSSECGSMNSSLGTDDVALYRQPGEEEKKARAHQFYLDQGWQPLAMRQHANT